MADRPVIVRETDGSGSNVAMFSIVAIVAIAVLAGLLYWQPWNMQPHNSTTTVITQPANPPAQAPAAQAPAAQSGGANSGSNANSDSKP
jgi:hypothetical protein